MIDKREIIDTATVLGIGPHVIEKDYVLGWLLWGIHNHEALAESWSFKGGTCLKKCFVETYRFSEDLDFTLTDAAHIDIRFLTTTFAEIGARIYEETGIEFPADYAQFEIYRNPRGHDCVQGRIGYRGPVSPRGRNAPRVKLDLTVDERIVLPPARSAVFHPYSDGPVGGIVVQSYPYEGRSEHLANVPGRATYMMSSTYTVTRMPGLRRLYCSTCSTRNARSRAWKSQPSSRWIGSGPIWNAAGTPCLPTSFLPCHPSKHFGGNYAISLRGCTAGPPPRRLRPMSAGLVKN